MIEKCLNMPHRRKDRLRMYKKPPGTFASSLGQILAVQKFPLHCCIAIKHIMLNVTISFIQNYSVHDCSDWVIPFSPVAIPNIQQHRDMLAPSTKRASWSSSRPNQKFWHRLWVLWGCSNQLKIPDVYDRQSQHRRKAQFLWYTCST